MASKDDSEILEGLDEAVESDNGSMSFDEVLEALNRMREQTNNKTHAEEALKALSHLNDEALELIYASPEGKKMIEDAHNRANANAKPGSPILDSNGRQIGKVPYSLEWCYENFPTVEWTPTRTTEISYNGVAIWVNAYEPVKSPACFRDIFENSERDRAMALRRQGDVLQQAAGPNSVVTVGWRKASDEELERMYGSGNR